MLRSCLSSCAPVLARIGPATPTAMLTRCLQYTKERLPPPEPEGPWCMGQRSYRDPHLLINHGRLCRSLRLPCARYWAYRAVRLSLGAPAGVHMGPSVTQKDDLRPLDERTFGHRVLGG